MNSDISIALHGSQRIISKHIINALFLLKGIVDKTQAPPLVRKENHSKKRSIPLQPLNKTTCTKAKEIVTNSHEGGSTIHIEDYLICGDYVTDIYGYLIEQQVKQPSIIIITHIHVGSKLILYIV